MISRIKYLRLLGIIFTLLILTRLLYVQVVKAESFKASAKGQYQAVSRLLPERGDIRASDGFPLATSLTRFLLFADPQLIKSPDISSSLIPILYPEASPSAVIAETARLKDLLSQINLRWVALQDNINPPQKTAIENLSLEGLGFEQRSHRYYPEASLSAQVLGFVGKDEFGNSKGYFGLEGFYDLELSGREGELTYEIDLLGLPISIGGKKEKQVSSGRHLQTTIDRVAQFIVEKHLKLGLEKYGAKSGTVTVMEPKTGRILAMASIPSFDPAKYQDFQSEVFKNPIISESYEPGSTFKVVVMSAALNEKLVKPDTICTNCEGPIRFDKYTIGTWDNHYFPNTDMNNVILNSDNVGMVFVAEKLGIDKFLDYYQAFGFDSTTGIDLEEETLPPQRPEKDWSYIDLATASFGQGLAVTPIQMVRAVSAIANGGQLVTPIVVDKIIEDKKDIKLDSPPRKKILSTEAASTMTEMMVNAVNNGKIKALKTGNFDVAGKTGTAQVPISGHYDTEKTVASFIGFAPARDPRFVMLVTLREPQTSPWGSTTAAPIWFSIADEFFRLYNITPN